MRDVVGHRQTCAQLARAVQTGQVSHAYLLTGPDAIGKTTLAREFARLLQCSQPDLTHGEACGMCSSCVKIASGNHPDVLLVEPPAGKRTLPIEAVREVLRAANLAPVEGQYRIFLLPEIERMLVQAVNALLKTLEEPPADVVLLLTSNEPEQLLPTVLSRCQMLALQPLATEEVAQALVQRWGQDESAARALAALANGRLGWAVRAARDPELREQRAQELEQITKLTLAPRDERLRQAGQLATDGETARRILELWTLWWRDVVLAANGASHLATTGPARQQAQQQGTIIGPEHATMFLHALLRARAQLDANANPRLTLEVLMLDLPMLPANFTTRH